jgi:lipopolysaccharide export system protein LptA
MARGPELALALVLTAALPAAGQSGRERSGGTDLSASAFGNRKEPITINSDALEYDYKGNVVVYLGDVQATQVPVKLRSDVLTVTFEQSGEKSGGEKPADPTASNGTRRLRQIVASGKVRIDHGTRWATGGRATFDQSARTIVLTEEPVLHDGANEVAGDRVVVYLDEDRSVVEGGRKRVKAVLYPGKEDGLAPRGPAPDDEARATAGTGAGRGR